MIRRLRPAAPAAVALALAATLLAACGSSAPPAPPTSQGIVQNRPVPDVPLLDAEGRTVSLASYRGKYVVMAPFLTLCQEECPLVAGAYFALEKDVAAAGLGKRVVFLTVSVDPWRDTPARLAAYARRFGADWTMLTGSQAQLKRFWSFFGVWFQKVPEPSPPGTDWLTGRTLTMDVDHTDGYILIDTAGHERFLDANAVNLHGVLRPDLKAQLDGPGLANLNQQTGPSWTIGDALSSLSWMVGREIPPSAGG